MRNIIMTIGLAIAALLGATPADAKFVHVTLAPAANLSKFQEKSGNATSACFFGCGVGGYGSCDLASYETPRIGYHNVYDAGTSPCNCWKWQACSWREFIRFDFSSLQSKTVVESHLQFNTHAVQTKSGFNLGKSASCAIRLYVAATAWNKYAIPGELIAAFKPGPTSAGTNVNLQIGGIVRQWVNGQRANRGLFFVGPSEKLASKSNDSCYVQLSDVSLVVTINVK
jgi:hypothetical protein